MGGISNAGNTGGKPVSKLRLEKEFGISPVRGLRWWFVASWPGGAVLRSVFVPYMWLRGVNEAECVVGRDHRPPDLECSCGFYVFRPSDMFNKWDHMRSSRVTVMGHVDMTGRIIECEKGWKAERVEIPEDAPLVLEVSCAAFCDEPPTVVSPSNEGYWAACETHRNPGDVSLDAGTTIPELARQLEARYDRDVIYWRDNPWQTLESL